MHKGGDEVDAECKAHAGAHRPLCRVCPDRGHRALPDPLRLPGFLPYGRGNLQIRVSVYAGHDLSRALDGRELHHDLQGFRLRHGGNEHLHRRAGADSRQPARGFPGRVRVCFLQFQREERAVCHFHGLVYGAHRQRRAAPLHHDHEDGAGEHALGAHFAQHLKRTGHVPVHAVF